MPTSCKGLPFTGFISLALRKSHPQSFKAIFHLAAAFPLRQFMGNSQLGCPAVRCISGRIGISNEISDLFVL